MSNLNDKDRYIAKRYIICRSAIKGFNKDLALMGDDLELGSVYKKLINGAMSLVNQELNELRKYPLRCQFSGQPTVYEVKIGNRNGYIEINKVEIVEEINKFFEKQISLKKL